MSGQSTSGRKEGKMIGKEVAHAIKLYKIDLEKGIRWGFSDTALPIIVE